jgi:hypothetical protein
MLAPSTRVNFWLLTTKAREEGARYADYRHRLSPELSADRFYGTGLFAIGQFRFERGKARNRTWREVGRRPFDWASRSLKREFAVVIMVEVRIAEMCALKKSLTEPALLEMSGNPYRDLDP